MFNFIKHLVYSINNLIQFRGKDKIYSKFDTINQVNLKSRNTMKYERTKNLESLSKLANYYLSEYQEIFLGSFKRSRHSADTKLKKMNYNYARQN
jgi:hypothetical protein